MKTEVWIVEGLEGGNREINIRQWIRILKWENLFKDVFVAVEHSFSKDYQMVLGENNVTFWDEIMFHMKNVSVMG